MNENEYKMKEKGESKVWASLTNSNGNAKDISSTQIGQQILFDEALRILEDFNVWVTKSSKLDKTVRTKRRLDIKRLNLYTKRFFQTCLLSKLGEL